MKAVVFVTTVIPSSHAMNVTATKGLPKHNSRISKEPKHRTWTGLLCPHTLLIISRAFARWQARARTGGSDKNSCFIVRRCLGPFMPNVLSAACHTKLCACDAWLSSIPAPSAWRGRDSGKAAHRQRQHRDGGREKYLEHCS